LDGKKHSKGEPLISRIFYVKVEAAENTALHKVKLEAMDNWEFGNDLPDRVIFIICLDEINRIFQQSEV